MRDPGEDDDALVRAAREGDRQAFALLYHRYKPDVWNLAYLTLRNHHEAEDGLQETFVRALRAISSQVPVESVRPWLLSICRNVCLDRLRAGRRRPVISIDDERVPELASAATADERRLDLQRALAALPQEDREAFLLVDVLGYRSHEAAAILGLAAPSTLRSRLASARRQLVPALSDGPCVQAPEIWGVYHQPPESAIVASFPSAARSGARPGGPAGVAGIADLIANFDRSGTPAAVERMRLELVDFFDRLDDRIPPKLRVLAVIDGRSAPAPGSAQHWLSDHPRWQVRRAVSHAGWLLEVESLLRAAGTERHRSALAALDTPAPFLWTQLA